jgi:hypothetical protein
MNNWGLFRELLLILLFFYYGLDLGKTVKIWVFEKIDYLVQKHIGFRNTPLVKCIK